MSKEHTEQLISMQIKNFGKHWPESDLILIIRWLCSHPEITYGIIDEVKHKSQAKFNQGHNHVE